MNNADNKTICYVCDRLREPSTWRGLVWVLTAAGISVYPEMIPTLTAGGAFVAGIIGMVTKQ